MRLVIGMGSCGNAAGAEGLQRAFAKLGLATGKTGCNGMCFLEPIVDVYDDNDQLLRRLVRVQEQDVPAIAAAVQSGDLSGTDSLAITGAENAFLTQQTRVVLRNCGTVDPESLESALSLGAYTALKKVLSGMSPEQVIDCIKVSGLRGRGGAGFPTWFKWNAARGAKGDDKFIICNADEGDPGAFMDRALIESDPHTLLEGLLIAAYAVGAKRAYVYVRAEYPLAVRRLLHAIEEAKAQNYAGANILGTDFCCEIGVQTGAGAFVCGEETALIASLEGERGMPRLKPPFPAEAGYWRKPTVINNVETLGNVSWIINNGGEAFAAMGTADSKGTKVFALTGKVKRGGLVEIPMGKTLREVIFDIGGGIRGDKQCKAVQLGGPSGGCIPESLLDTVIDYAELAKTGAIMGSGGMVVMDETTCMVGMAQFFLDFTTKESCGKCTHCRIGTKRLQEILTRITEGKGKPGDLELLDELCNAVKDGALCGLGQTAPNPVLSTLRYFRDEYEAHINEKRCPAHACKALAQYSIEADKCRGCTACARKCPADAITGAVRQAHSIDPAKCIRCGSCAAACKFGAVRVD